MKNYILVITLLLPICLFAQRNTNVRKHRNLPKDIKYYNSIFGEGDADFDLLKAPEKWSSEPVVALAVKTHIGFLRASGLRQTKGVTRKRILIQDKSVLDEFAEYYYHESDAFGLTHIKPDGTTAEIDFDNAIEVKTEVPDYYLNTYNTQVYHKIAIPNLEVGDILDYFEVFTQRYKDEIQFIAPISYSYPVVKQELFFDVDKLYTVYYKSFNNAPAFIEDPEGGLDANGRKRKMIKRLVLTDLDRPAAKHERWSYRNLSEPIIKFMVVGQDEFFGDKKQQIKNELDLQWVFCKVMSSSTTSSTYKNYNAKLKSRLRKMNISDLNDQEKIDAIYSALKLVFFENRMVSVSLADVIEADQMIDRAVSFQDQYVDMNSVTFSKIFINVLAHYEINADYVIAVPRYYGTPKENIIASEHSFGVFISQINKYYWTIDNFRVGGDQVYYFQGANGYRVDPMSIRGLNADFREITIPQSKSNDNMSITNIDIVVDESNQLDFDCRYEFVGLFKNNYNSRILNKIDYFKTEREKLYTKEEKDLNERKVHKKRKSKFAQRLTEKAKIKQEAYSEEKDKAIENWFISDYEIEGIDSYDVTSYGTTKEFPTLKIQAKFKSDKYIKKAGPNLIFDLGKLISSQVQLTKEEMAERKSDVHYNFARTIVNNINITLPDGVNAQGLDALNLNIDNINGAFVSTVRQEGNLLKVETTKTYKKQTVPKQEWQDMVEVLEAAYKFTQLKVVLK